MPTPKGNETPEQTTARLAEWRKGRAERKRLLAETLSEMPTAPLDPPIDDEDDEGADGPTDHPADDDGGSTVDDPSDNPAAASEPARSSSEAAYRNTHAVTLKEGTKGQLVLDAIVKRLLRGEPFDTVVRSMNIDRRSIERLRRSKTPWGAHVDNSVNMAEAGFERRLVDQLLKSQNSNDVKKAEVYIAAFKPKFSAQQKLRIEYEAQALIEAVKRHVDQTTLLAILDELAGFDVNVLMLALDERLLPK